MPPPWIVIAALAAALLFIVGLYARINASLARRRAPRALALVREALARRMPDEARRLLPSGFYMPISGRYSPEDAAVALGLLSAFEETMGTYRLSAAIITHDLREALERCARRGTRVPWRLIGRLMSVLWSVSVPNAPLPKIIREAAARAAQQEGELWEDEDDLQMAQILPRAMAPVGAGIPPATLPLTGPRSSGRPRAARR
jgi:hypothetical protein